MLVIGADVMSSIIDYTDRATCVIFGDGAGAVLLEPADDDPSASLISCTRWTAPAACSLYMPGGGSLQSLDARNRRQENALRPPGRAAVFKFAVRKMTELCEEILKRNNIKGREIDAFIPHQANKRIITATADRLDLRPEA